MKIFFLFLFVALLSHNALAGNYYVSSSQGKDSYSGLSQDYPFKSIEKVNSLTFNPGDKILFKCGDSWANEMLIINDSGTVSSPITYGSYPRDCDSRPIISGSAPITDWVHSSGNIYVADLSAPANSTAFSETDTTQIMGITQLFRDDQRLMPGRWPNPGSLDNGYSAIDGTPSTTSFFDNQLPAGDWTGAVAHIKSMTWLIINRIVSSTNNTTLNFSEDTTCYNGSCAGWGYFLNNHLMTLDMNGEWFYDEATYKVYLYSDSGLPSQVEGSVIKSQSTDGSGCIVLGPPYVNHVAIDNFMIQNCFSHGLTSTGSMKSQEHGNITIQNNYIKDVDSTGIRLVTWINQAEGGEDSIRGGSDILVSNNIIDGPNHFGIEAASHDSSFLDNTIKNIGLLEYVGKSGLGCGFSGSSCTENGDGIKLRSDNPDYAGFNNLIQYNTLENIGYNGIDIFGANNIITNNFINMTCLSKSDCAAIRTFGRDNLQSTKAHDDIIKDNIIKDIQGNTDGTIEQFRPLLGMGVYIDHYSRDMSVEGNTIINTTTVGINVKSSSAIIKDNIVYNSANGGDLYKASIAVYNGDAAVSILTGNTMYALNKMAWTLGTDDVSRLHFCDYNTIFHPYVDKHITYQRWDRATFAEWQALSGHDVHSQTNWFNLELQDPPVSRIFWNATKVPKSVKLDNWVYHGLDQHTIYSGSLLLQPYQSKILIKSDTPYEPRVDPGSSFPWIIFLPPLMERNYKNRP